jgi:putative PIN family toxin of toxin-antitoxin system
MMRVVADTNVFISALMFGGLPGRLLDLALRRNFTLVTSKALLDELDEKLGGKFAVSERDVQAIRAKLESHATVVNPDFELHAVAGDPDDNRVLECALAGKADSIVSGDRHLLQMVSYEGITIFHGPSVPGDFRIRARRVLARWPTYRGIRDCAPFIAALSR